MRQLLPNVDINFSVDEDDTRPSHAIIDFVENNQTDILCLVKRNHNMIYRLFASSTVNEVLNRSVKAILVLHMNNLNGNFLRYISSRFGLSKRLFLTLPMLQNALARKIRVV
jgi:hypothetical protein